MVRWLRIGFRAILGSKSEPVLRAGLPPPHVLCMRRLIRVSRQAFQGPWLLSVISTTVAHDVWGYTPNSIASAIRFTVGVICGTDRPHRAASRISGCPRHNSEEKWKSTTAGSYCIVLYFYSSKLVQKCPKCQLRTGDHYTSGYTHRSEWQIVECRRSSAVRSRGSSRSRRPRCTTGEPASSSIPE